MYSSSSITLTMELGSIIERSTSSCWAEPGWAAISESKAKCGGRRSSGWSASANLWAMRWPFQEIRNPSALARGSGGGCSLRIPATLRSANDLCYKSLRSPTTSLEVRMSSLTRWVLAHKRVVVVSWLVLTIAGIAAAGPASKALKQQFSVPGKEGWETNQAISQRYGGTGGNSAPLVPVITLPAGKQVNSPGVRADLAKVDARLERALPGTRIASYSSTGSRAFVSSDGRTTFVLAYPQRDPD